MSLAPSGSAWLTRFFRPQPTMARLERGDASVSAATYILCLSQLNPQLDLTVLLPRSAAPAPMPAPTATSSAAAPVAGGAPASGVDDFASLLSSWAPTSF